MHPHCADIYARALQLDEPDKTSHSDKLGREDNSKITARMNLSFAD